MKRRKKVEEGRKERKGMRKKGLITIPREIRRWRLKFENRRKLRGRE